MVCVIVAAVISMLYRKEIEYVKGDYKKYFMDLLPEIGAAVFMIGIYLPNELYISNINDFNVPFAEYFAALLVGSFVVSMIIIVLSIFLLPKAVLKIYGLVICGIAIMGYIQMMFLNGELNVLNGQEQIWENSTVIVNSVIWLIVVGIIVISGYAKSFLNKAYRYICIYIFMIQMVTLVYLVATNDINTQAERKAMTTEGSLELASDNNILIFLLDAFDSSYFDKIVEDDSSFVSELSNFTYYENTSSQFAHTTPAVSYLLNSVKWDSENKKTCDTGMDNVLELISRKDYNIGIYTETAQVSEKLRDLSANYSDKVKVHCDITATIKNMFKTSLYKISPFAIKLKYSYYSSDISEIAKAEDVWTIDDDIPFYEDLTSEGVSVSSNYRNAFRLYHMRGPHAPFYLCDDLKYDNTGRNSDLYSQARASMKIVYEYLNQLKELGLYDSSTIIITADHGQTAESNVETGEIIKPSSPVMLVKQPYETNDGLKVNYAPVSQEELFPTILKAAGIETDEYGRTFDEIDENEDRIREYIDVYSDYIIQYSINGNVKDINSWSISSVDN
jgi:hypothetical protein